MTTKLWRGDAPAVAQKTRITPGTVVVGNVFSLTMNGKAVSVTATAATAANVCTLLAAALAATAIPEFLEFSVTNEGDTLLLTALEAGVPFTITASDSGSTPLGVSVTTTTQGVAKTNSVQSFKIPIAGTGTFVIWFGDQVTSALNISDSAATIKTAFEALSTVGSSNTTITKVDNANGDYSTITITFGGSFAGYAVGTLTVYLTYKQPWIQTTQDGGRFNPVRNEIQTIRYPDTMGGGYTSQLTLSGQTTSALDLQATTGVAVQAAIIALSNVESCSVTKTGRVYTVEFTGTDGNAGQAMFTASAFSGVPSDAESVYYLEVTNTAPTTTFANEIQIVSLTGAPGGGTFTLTYAGQTTGTIAYNASSATVTTALEALSNIAVADVSVSGSAGGPWTVTFQGLLAATNVSEMTGSGANLTGGGSAGLTVGEIVASSGPNHWNTAANWIPSGVPGANDKVNFEFGDSSALYGLDQSAVNVQELNFAMAYTGQIGLPRENENGYLEYRERSLKIDVSNVLIGWGEGSGSGKIALNTLTNASSIEIRNTGGSREAGIPAVIWKGIHAVNQITVYDGDFGASLYADEVSTIGQMIVRGGTVRLANATLSELRAPAGSVKARKCTLGGDPLEL